MLSQKRLLKLASGQPLLKGSRRQRVGTRLKSNCGAMASIVRSRSARHARQGPPAEVPQTVQVHVNLSTHYCKPGPAVLQYAHSLISLMALASMSLYLYLYSALPNVVVSHCRASSCWAFDWAQYPNNKCTQPAS